MRQRTCYWLFLLSFLSLILHFASSQSNNRFESDISNYNSLQQTTHKLDTLEKRELQEITIDFANDYLDLLIGSTFYGEWSIAQTSTETETTTLGRFATAKGLSVLNPYDTESDIVLLEDQYIDQKFVFFFVNFKDIFQDLKAKDGVLTVTNREVKYWMGDDLLRQEITVSETCLMKHITLKVLNGETNKAYDPTKDKEKDAAVQIYMEGESCPFNFYTNLMKPFDERFNSQVWTFSLLYLIWSMPNIMIGLRKFRDLENIDKPQGAQFFLIFNINFYVSMWSNMFAQEIAGNIGLILVALLNLFIWSSNFGTSFRCIQGRRNPCFLAASIFLTIIMRIVFTYSHAVLLAIFILIPLIDIGKFFKASNRPVFDLPLYVGILLPNLIIIAYLTLYDHNFARLSAQPQLTQYFIVFLFLAFGILPIQIEIRRFILKIKRERRFVNPKYLNAEDMCPICMQSLLEGDLKSADIEELSDPIVEPRDDENPRLTETKKTVNKQQQRVIKTDCGHLFHLKCLSEWLKIKAECPSCRKAIVDII